MELLSYSGGTGVQVLTHLCNAVSPTRCVPSAGRQGVVVHLPKGGDTGDCSNYRPLTLLPVVDKLFAKLLSERIARAVCLHDQQHSFRPGRGTLNPLQNLPRRRFCGSAPRLTSLRPRMPAFSMLQKHMTSYRTLYYSTASFSAALWV